MMNFYYKAQTKSLNLNKTKVRLDGQLEYSQCPDSNTKNLHDWSKQLKLNKIKIKVKLASCVARAGNSR